MSSGAGGAAAGGGGGIVGADEFPAKREFVLEPKTKGGEALEAIVAFEYYNLTGAGSSEAPTLRGVQIGTVQQTSYVCPLWLLNPKENPKRKECRQASMTMGRILPHLDGKEHPPLPPEWQSAFFDPTGKKLVSPSPLAALAPLPSNSDPPQLLPSPCSTWYEWLTLQKTPAMCHLARAEVEAAEARNSDAPEAKSATGKSDPLNDEEWELFLNALITANGIKKRAVRDRTHKNGALLHAQHLKSLGYGVAEPVDCPLGASKEDVEEERKRRLRFEVTILETFEAGKSHTQDYGIAGLVAAWEDAPAALRAAPMFQKATDRTTLKETISNTVSNLYAKFKDAKASQVATGGGADGSPPCDDAVFAGAAASASAADAQQYGSGTFAPLFSATLHALTTAHSFCTPPRLMQAMALASTYGTKSLARVVR